MKNVDRCNPYKRSLQNMLAFHSGKPGAGRAATFEHPASAAYAELKCQLSVALKWYGTCIRIRTDATLFVLPAHDALQELH
jgi:hypothetical protein